jgi:hypothetical protein
MMAIASSTCGFSLIALCVESGICFTTRGHSERIDKQRVLMEYVEGRVGTHLNSACLASLAACAGLLVVQTWRPSILSTRGAGHNIAMLSHKGRGLHLGLMFITITTVFDAGSWWVTDRVPSVGTAEREKEIIKST